MYGENGSNEMTTETIDQHANTSRIMAKTLLQFVKRRRTLSAEYRPGSWGFPDSDPEYLNYLLRFNFTPKSYSCRNASFKLRYQSKWYA